jgi:hypothetical protein
MGVVIGDTTYVATWGALRFPLGNGGEDKTVDDHNIVWNSGFKTTEGNGFFRCDALQLSAIYQPYVVFDTAGPTFYLSNATTAIVLDQREADKLVGETVSLTGAASFTITSDYLTLSGQSVSTSGTDPILSIGLLTGF